MYCIVLIRSELTKRREVYKKDVLHSSNPFSELTKRRKVFVMDPGFESWLMNCRYFTTCIYELSLRKAICVFVHRCVRR